MVKRGGGEEAVGREEKKKGGMLEECNLDCH